MHQQVVLVVYRRVERVPLQPGFLECPMSRCRALCVGPPIHVLDGSKPEQTISVVGTDPIVTKVSVVDAGYRNDSGALRSLVFHALYPSSR